MSDTINKIDAKDKTLSDILTKKYTVDFFQREYSWKKEHIEQLVIDLTSSFMDNYEEGHTRADGGKYEIYYLGPFVIRENNVSRSIIDGQQRLTSISLFFIFLNNLLKEQGVNENLDALVFSDYRGKKTFNIEVEERTDCFNDLYEKGDHTPKADADESTKNMLDRYHDIESTFPDEICGEKLLIFLDWFRHNVIMVEIVAYSDKKAYEIFESMNDRGLNLTPTEMLKGYLLSKITNPQSRNKANEKWKNMIQSLHDYEKHEDQRFIQAWLRAQYAETIRQARAGAANEDFEIISRKFHVWVRDNLDKIQGGLKSDADFENFIFNKIDFFYKAYKRILEAERTLSKELEYVFYTKRWGVASSLSYPLMLAPLKTTDSQEIQSQKINLVARYIESFAVRRSINRHTFSANAIRYTMYMLIKEIRHLDLDSLRQILKNRLAQSEDKFEVVDNFKLHKKNRRFVTYLLSRITGFIEEKSGSSSDFRTFFAPAKGRPFQIEHIWADHFDQHTDEFEHESEFKEFRDKIGGLILLPQGPNQSYGDLGYKDKHVHYVKENILAKSLCDISYRNNPNFTRMCEYYQLPFKSHSEFKKQDFDQRAEIYMQICDIIWPEQLPTGDQDGCSN
ncbi:MAG: DUF262 domain-containing protein [Phycisphaeraceae bacterium]|nr:DUF262 domain-containing protein [Phycisphaeraceae bacterium]